MNHENTKPKKHEMFSTNFRGFVVSSFRDFVMKIASIEMWKTVCMKLISDNL